MSHVKTCCACAASTLAYIKIVEHISFASVPILVFLQAYIG
jgi:hypothetical protein